jgi:diguanylate cyclase (GGDEF)-like protein
MASSSPESGSAFSLGDGASVLVVEDEDVIRELLVEVLEGHGFRVSAAANVAQARALVATRTFDVALLDKNLPDGSSLSLVPELSVRADRIGTILMTAYASLESAVEAVRLRVDDYVTKPFQSLEEVVARVRRIAAVIRLERENQRLLGELRSQNQRLEAMVARDPLTELFNHAFFQDVVERELARSRRSGSSFCLLMIDVDGFRGINETIGHARGNQLLQEVAAHLLDFLAKRSDLPVPAADALARYGPDLFALLLPGCSRSLAASVAESLRRSVEVTFAAPGRSPRLTVSVGLAEYSSDGQDRRQLLAACDAALLAAKRSGRNRTVAYSPSLAASSKRGEDRQAIESLLALDRSLERNLFTHVYQPIVRAGTYQVVAYESLCRPGEPSFNGPGELITTAERAGRVLELGRALRGGTIDVVSSFPEDVLLFVNVHPMEFAGPSFLEDEEVVERWAHRLVLEVTESAAITDQSQFRSVLRRLKSRGFRIALDDLGAGYASLNALAQIEPDFVKLDMALVRRVTDDPRTARLVKHILEFAADERMLTIAEGIETEEERRIVEDLGCPLLQGFYFGRPVPAAKLFGVSQTSEEPKIQAC